jgi:hypothetical protein
MQAAGEIVGMQLVEGIVDMQLVEGKVDIQQVEETDTQQAQRVDVPLDGTYVLHSFEVVEFHSLELHLNSCLPFARPTIVARASSPFVATFVVALDVEVAEAMN